jgi:beta-N-acetylhexosaminidase
VLPSADELTHEQQVGQMFMVGVSGRRLTPAERRFLRDYHIGGVILMGQNVSDPAQVARLTADIQAAIQAGSGVPALIAIDQEGGRIARLRRGFPRSASSHRLAATGDIARAARAGSETGRALRRIGVNMNLAPVMDVVGDPRHGVIGDRSFGGDPRVVGRWGSEYIRALQNEGVIATAKHFPGHGATNEDTHLRFTVVRLPRETLLSQHVAPFEMAVGAHVGAIMPAHVAYTAWDAPNAAPVPATLSPAIVRVLLRENLGFQGVVISDSMVMRAVAGPGSGALWRDTVRRAVAAGVNVLLIPDDVAKQRAALASLRAALKRNDPVLRAAVRDSAARVLALKARFRLDEP